MPQTFVGLFRGRISVGAHGCTHQPLTSLPAAARVEEIQRSRAEAEALSALPVTGFTYPHGDRDAETIDMVRRAGYAGRVPRAKPPSIPCAPICTICRGSPWATGGPIRCLSSWAPPARDREFPIAWRDAMGLSFLVLCLEMPGVIFYSVVCHVLKISNRIVRRVSVLNIFLNAEAFIAEATDTGLAQSFPSFELILVDDGSTDASSAIARRYAETHPDRVRYIDHPQHANRGMSASRNAGIAVARGDLIAFIDADDVWLPDKLRDQVQILGAYPQVGLVAGQHFTGTPGRAAKTRACRSDMSRTRSSIHRSPSWVSIRSARRRRPLPPA